jgi:hypothetical protein
MNARSARSNIGTPRMGRGGRPAGEDLQSIAHVVPAERAGEHLRGHHGPLLGQRRTDAGQRKARDGRRLAVSERKRVRGERREANAQRDDAEDHAVQQRPAPAGRDERAFAPRQPQLELGGPAVAARKWRRRVLVLDNSVPSVEDLTSQGASLQSVLFYLPPL